MLSLRAWGSTTGLDNTSIMRRFSATSNRAAYGESCNAGDPLAQGLPQSRVPRRHPGNSMIYSTCPQANSKHPLPTLLDLLGHLHSGDCCLCTSNNRLVNSASKLENSAALLDICFSLSLCRYISGLFTLTLNCHTFSLRGRPQTAYHSSDT